MYYDSVAKAVIVTSDEAEESRHYRKQGQRYAKEAAQLYKSERYFEAAQQFTRAIEKYPDNAGYYSDRALCFMDLGDIERAIADCDISLQYDPSNVKFLFRKSLAKYGAEDVNGAIEILLQILNTNPPEDVLNDIEENLDTYLESLDPSTRDVWQTRIAEAKRASANNCSPRKASVEPKDYDVLTDPKNPLKADTIWIENFTGNHACEAELRKLFGSFGNIINYVIGDRDTYLTLESAQSAAQALRHGQNFNFYGNKLIVRYKLGPVEFKSSKMSENKPTKEYENNTSYREKTKTVNYSSAKGGQNRNGTMASNGQAFAAFPPLTTITLQPLAGICSEIDLWNITNFCGEVIRVYIDRKQQIGYVEFTHPDSAIHARNTLNGYLVFGIPQICHVLTASKKSLPSKDNKATRDSRVLWVGNVNPAMDENAMRHMFERFKPVNVRIFRATNSGFIDFGSEQDATAALREMKGARVGTWTLKLENKILK